MARLPDSERPHNREVENEMIRPPERNGEPPRPATEPPQASEELPPVKRSKLGTLLDKVRAIRIGRRK